MAGNSLGSRRTSPPAGRKDRAGLARALAAIESGEADVVVVSRLDRLARSVAHIASILERFPGGVVALDVGLVPDSPAGMFVSHVVAAAGELERGLVQARTRDALRAARERGVRLGRPRQMSTEAIERIRELHRSGMRVAHIAEQLNREAVPTPTGRGTWHPPGVCQGTPLHRRRLARLPFPPTLRGGFGFASRQQAPGRKAGFARVPPVVRLQ